MKKQIANNRGVRVASNIRKTVAEIFRDRFADDAVLSRVSIVDADSGLQFIKIYYHAPLDIKGLREKLEFVTPIVRHELAARIRQKYVPEIRFVYDDTLEKSERIDELLRSI
ncbi:MAG: 30S ribosome-binding factor RbfA [Alphaproteobacteria bacterium]|nr:30S ribosome-binding factor RbfA [Alphaproteobacteria bacterium]